MIEQDREYRIWQIKLELELSDFNLIQINLLVSPKTVAWKHVMHLMIPNTKWHNQYQMWQEYELNIDENTGEMSLSLAKEEVQDLHSLFT